MINTFKDQCFKNLNCCSLILLVGCVWFSLKLWRNIVEIDEILYHYLEVLTLCTFLHLKG